MKKTYLVAGLIVAVMFLWMLSGVFKSKESHKDVSADRAEQQAVDSKAARITRVRTSHLTAEPQRVEIVLRGRTEAKRVVDIKAETNGRVIAVPVEKGQQVKTGDVLCQLSDDSRREQLSQAQAAFDKYGVINEQF